MTSAVNFTQKVMDVKEQLKCPITLKQITDPHGISPCGHIFDGSAIRSWLTISRTCPLDRGSVIDVTPDAVFQSLLQKFDLLKGEAQNLGELISLEQEISRYKNEAYSVSASRTQARIIAIQKRLFNEHEAGLYLLGHCQNKHCFQNQKEMSVFRGTGQFSMNRESVMTNCLDCDFPMSIDAIAIRSHEYEIEGMKLSGDYLEEKRKGRPFEDQELKIISPLSEWKFLELNIEPERTRSNFVQKYEEGDLDECFKRFSFFQWIKNKIQTSKTF